MNETLKGLWERKSVRVFENKPIPEDMKNLILDASIQAPSAGNQVMYTIIDVTDQALKDELAITCDNQPFIATAPLVLIFVADFQRWYECFDYAKAEPRLPGAGDMMLATTDACIAAQNAVVAAHSLGLGSCYIGDILERNEKHREMLNLPEYAIPVAMLVIGYPTVQQMERPKPPRFNRKYIVHENKYRLLSEDEHIRMYEERESQTGREVKPFEDYIQAFCKRKYNSDFSQEMTRSVEAYFRQWMKP